MDVKVTSDVIKAPTCTEDGEIKYTASCTINGKPYTDTKPAPVPKTGHEYKETVTKATFSENGKSADGKIVKTCIHDGCTYSKTTTIYYPKTIQLSTTTYTYNGSVKNPSVTVIDRKGNTISDKYYTVDKDSGRKNIGTYTYTIKFKGNYSGTKTLKFTIVPAKPAISSLTNASGGITVKWGKVSGAGGYYIYRSKDGKSYSRIGLITGSATTSYTDTKSTASGSKYWYKIIAYKTVSGKTYKSAESSVKTIYRLTRPAISGLTNATNGITVKWGKVSGAGGYYIYRSKDGGAFTYIKNVTGNATTSYTDTKATANGSKYQYKVIAYKTVSGKTYKSKESSVKTIYRLTRPSISSLTNSVSKKMTVKWSRNTKATGYQIQYSKSGSFSSGVTTVKVSGNSTVKKTIASLTKGKKYYVRVRAYKTVSGTTYYSSWSTKKSVTISK